MSKYKYLRKLRKFCREVPQTVNITYYLAAFGLKWCNKYKKQLLKNVDGKPLINNVPKKVIKYEQTEQKQNQIKQNKKVIKLAPRAV